MSTPLFPSSTNKHRLALVRQVILELIDQGTIHTDHEKDVHHHYLLDDNIEPPVAGNWLDMSSWVTKASCGTAACLAGWLARDPRVQAAGLRLEEEGEDDPRLVPVYGVGPGRSRNIWALRRFLDFEEVENAIYIFGPEHPNTFDSALLRLDEAVSRESELNHARTVQKG